MKLRIPDATAKVWIHNDDGYTVVECGYIDDFVIEMSTVAGPIETTLDQLMIKAEKLGVLKRLIGSL